MDARRRELERAGASGDVDAAARLLIERLRAEELAPPALELAALCGDLAAARVARLAPPAASEAWLEALAARGPEVAARAALVAAGNIELRLYGSNARFDGPDDALLLVLERLAAFLRAPGEERRTSLREAIAAVDAEGAVHPWGIGAALTASVHAALVVCEPDHALDHLREALSTACGGALPAERSPVRRAVEEALVAWSLRGEDPAAFYARRGERLGQARGLIRALAPLRDGRLVVASSDRRLALLELASGRPLGPGARLAHDPYALALDPSQQRLAVGDAQGEVTVWRAGDLALEARFPTGDAVHQLALLGGDRLLVVNGTGIGVWSAARGVRLEQVPAEPGARGLALLPSGLAACGGAGGRPLRFDPRAPHDRLHLGASEDEGPPITDLLGAGARLVSIHADGGVRVWDPATGASLGAFAGAGQPVYGVAASPDGARLALAGASGALRVLELGARDGPPGAVGVRELAAWQTPGVLLAAAFTPDGAAALSGARSGAIRRHELDPGRRVDETGQ